jgi:hypothetical protein
MVKQSSENELAHQQTVGARLWIKPTFERIALKDALGQQSPNVTADAQFGSS